MNSTTIPPGFRQLARKEVALLTGFLFLGLVLLPIVIFTVGKSVFGSYGGIGFVDFFGRISGKVLAGDGVAWFLVLSPYLGWQCLRLMVFAWRVSGRQKT